MENSDPSEKRCAKCGTSVEDRCFFDNVVGNCKETVTFPYMEVGQSMHFECYFERIIEKKLEELLP